MSRSLLLTDKDLKRLCTDLINKSAAAYDEAKTPFITNQTTKHYAVLSDELNLYFGKNYIKTAWLRDVFHASKTVGNHNISQELLDICTSYIANEPAKVYFDLEMTDNTRLKGLFGNWYLYSRYRNKSQMHISKLSVISDTKLLYDTTDNFYKNGTIEILGETRLCIFFKDNARFTTLLADIGHRQKLDDIEFIPAIYCGSGVLDTPYGCLALLRRVQTAYEDMPIGIYDFDNPILNDISKIDVIKQIKNSPNLYSARLVNMMTEPKRPPQ